MREVDMCNVRVTSVNSISGDVTYVISRGKQRVLFELKLKLQLEMELRDADHELTQIVTGELHIPEVCVDDLGEETMPSYKSTCEQSGCTIFFKEAAGLCWPQLQQSLKALMDQVK